MSHLELPGDLLIHHVFSGLVSSLGLLAIFSQDASRRGQQWICRLLSPKDETPPEHTPFLYWVSVNVVSPWFCLRDYSSQLAFSLLVNHYGKFISKGSSVYCSIASGLRQVL